MKSSVNFEQFVWEASEMHFGLSNYTWNMAGLNLLIVVLFILDLTEV